jgi:hypothetical protein
MIAQCEPNCGALRRSPRDDTPSVTASSVVVDVFRFAERGGFAQERSATPREFRQFGTPSVRFVDGTYLWLR